jgi:hypothetical protein
MNILILHKIAYHKIQYHTGIDHAVHDVTYVGTAERLKTVPEDLRCTRLEREDLGNDRVSESVLAAVAALPGAPRFDRVFSVSEYELLDAARVREHLQVPGPSLYEATLVRDKVAMKAAVSLAGIAVPRFLPLADALAAAGALPWTGRTVLKPTHGAGSEDVVIFDSAASCMRALQARATGVKALDGAAPAVSGFELEEFVEGDILHLDGLVQDGEVKAVIASRYVGTCVQYNANRPMGSSQFDLGAAQREWVQGVIRAVRIGAGAFHLEVIDSPRGYVFLEIGHRTGGGAAPLTTSLAWGADLQTLDLELLVGATRRDLGLLERQALFHGWCLFPGHRYGQGRWTAPPAVLARLRDDPRVVAWHERDAGEAFDVEPDYELNMAPLAALVAAPSEAAVRQYIVDMMAAVSWTVREPAVA